MFNVMIVDDEKPAIRKLAYQLEKLNGFGIDICGTYCSPSEALEDLAELSPNLVFLDIEMPGASGLETAEEIIERKPDIDIVFVTAYDKYALEAFDVNAVDYLLKPVSAERLEKTLARIERRRPPALRAGPAGAGFSIRVLGEPDIVRNGAPLNISWRSAKVRELFGFYVHNRNVKLHRNRILESIWGDMEYNRALANFNTCNYQLRKQLLETGSGIRVLFSGGYYRLDTGGCPCDADIADSILSKNRAVERESIGPVKDALAAYQGPYCDNISGIWIISPRCYYENLYVSNAVSAAKYYFKSKSYGECMEYARKAVEANSLCEEGWNLLLRVLELRGDRDGYVEMLGKKRSIFDKTGF